MIYYTKVFKRVRDVLHTLLNKKITVKNGQIVYGSDTYLAIDKMAQIKLNGNLILNDKCIKRKARTTLLRMDSNSKLKVNGDFSFYYGADIVLFEDSVLELGNSFINSDCKIRCHKYIKIGDGCAISHDVTMMDSDAHHLNGNKNTKPIIIEDNVWIGTRVTILSGVTVGEGAVIAAGSVVKNDVPKNCLVAGVPARVVKKNVEWSV